MRLAAAQQLVERLGALGYPALRVYDGGKGYGVTYRSAHGTETAVYTKAQGAALLRKLKAGKKEATR